MEINPRIDFIKTHPDAILPFAAHPDSKTGDSGHDFIAVENVQIPSGCSAIVPVGLTVAYITPGWWFKIEARSGLGFKHGIMPHPGIIDNSYRGDCSIKLYNFGKQDIMIHKGDKIAQLVVYPLVRAEISAVEEIQQTVRGNKGFGSTDSK